MALKDLLPDAKLSAVEINAKAAAELAINVPGVELHVGSILEFRPTAKWDLVMTKGVLIHINPDKLPIVYSMMYRHSSRYLLVAEYYNPKPVEVVYKGHTGKTIQERFRRRDHGSLSRSHIGGLWLRLSPRPPTSHRMI